MEKNEKIVFNTYMPMPANCEKQADGKKLDAIDTILKMSPETIHILNTIIQQMYQYMDVPYPSPLTDDERARCELVYYATRAKIECVKEVITWERAVNYNYSRGNHLKKNKGKGESKK